MKSWSPFEAAQLDHGLGRVHTPLPGHVGHGRIRWQPVLVDPDALEVGRSRLGAEPLPLAVVGVDGGIDIGPPQFGVAEDVHLLGERVGPQLPPRRQEGRREAGS